MDSEALLVLRRACLLPIRGERGDSRMRSRLPEAINGRTVKRQLSMTRTLVPPPDLVLLAQDPGSIAFHSNYLALMGKTQDAELDRYFGLTVATPLRCSRNRGPLGFARLNMTWREAFRLSRARGLFAQGFLALTALFRAAPLLPRPLLARDLGDLLDKSVVEYMIASVFGDIPTHRTGDLLLECRELLVLRV